MSICFRLGVGNVQSLRPDLARRVKNRPTKAYKIKLNPVRKSLNSGPGACKYVPLNQVLKFTLVILEFERRRKIYF